MISKIKNIFFCFFLVFVWVLFGFCLGFVWVLFGFCLGFGGWMVPSSLFIHWDTVVPHAVMHHLHDTITAHLAHNAIPVQ